MNCESVQSLLVDYLDGEVTPSERFLILAHLSNCSVCQQELDLLSTARSQVRGVLQRRARQAVPSWDAWNWLEARLTKAAQPSSKFSAWFSRKAPDASRAFHQRFGGVNMNKRSLVSAIAAVVVLTFLGVAMAKNVIPASAQQVLDRAYEAQSAQGEGKGIQHTRIEFYQNFCALPEEQGLTTITESYSDYETGNFRSVSTSGKTGKVIDLFAFDGQYIYNSSHEDVVDEGEQPQQEKDPRPSRFHCDSFKEGVNDGVLTVYRATQSGVVATVAVKPVNEDATDEMNEAMFEKMRSDPNTELVGKETWDDGRIVYVLRSAQPVKALVEDSSALPMGWVVSYFDVKTYKLLGSRATLINDGQERLVYSYRVLVDEILPANSHVAWDLTDLEDLTVVNDPEAEHVKLLPEVISEQELASYTNSAYLLSSVPDGFTLEIGAALNQPEDQLFSYTATYRDEAGDFLVIESVPARKVKFVGEGTGESYTTASGLKLTFMEDPKDSSEKKFTSVIVEAPEEAALVINSTLPREQVKALAEKLVLVE